ncbi:hypothetical protein M440DRAFT_1221048 [Trichoderma longibrachiatum ATCC 18648]|uniref:Uncharacterized protein n=1 Tax=Trichoderma longibrachiatum ATCC 18648 TaxID=983965 RepID=A0A2T4C830_TRILO|nr:hypothetical protein M440DRAFT_1221048 [Trichoderma longibrachiatum ATCC 18648]
MPSGVELEPLAGDVALSTDFLSLIHLTRYAALMPHPPPNHPMLDDETALGSDFIMSKTRHFAAGLENLAH